MNRNWYAQKQRTIRTKTNFSYSGLNYARFEKFIHNAERVTRIIYARPIITLNKIVPK